MSIFQDSSSLLNESRKIQRQIQEELNYIQEGKRAARRNRGKQRSSAPEPQAQPEKKEPKQRGAFRADIAKKGVASPQTTDLANAVKMFAGRQVPDSYGKQKQKEPTQRGSFRSSAKPKGVASPETADMAKTVSMISKNEPKAAEKKEPKKRGAFRADINKRGVASSQTADLDKAVKLVAGRQIPKKEAPASSQSTEKEQPKKPEATKAAPKPKETGRARTSPIIRNVPARKERIASRRASKNREASDLKISGSQLKNLYYSAPDDRATKNRERVVRGLKGGVRKYAEKIKDAGRRVVGKIKKFFGKEDVDLLFASQVILECDGYTSDEIEMILEWIDSQLDQEETFNCITILENAIDDLLLCQYIVENYAINTDLDIELVVEDMTDDEFEYIFENYIEEEVPVDRRLKSNRYVSKSFKRKRPMKPSY